MSEGNAKVEPMNECYQCQEALTYDPVDSVHPLCHDCQNDFDDWLQTEMMMIDYA